MRAPLHHRFGAAPRVVLIAALAAAAVATACNRAPATDPRLFTEWMRTAYGVLRAERLSPPVGARFMAYASSALYAGMAATSEHMTPLFGRLNGFPEITKPANVGDYDQTITAVSAERVVLDSLLRDGLATTRASVGRLSDSLEQARVTSGVNAAKRARSDSLGKSIGLAIVAWSHGDGFDSTRGRRYIAPIGRGLWVNDSLVITYATQSLSRASELVTLANPTNAMNASTTSDRGLILSRPKKPGLATLPAVNMAGATEPYWSQLRPFALERWDECPAAGAPKYGDKPGEALYDEAKIVYTTVNDLTPEQRKTALFWADNAGESGTPAGHWLGIASQLVSEQHLSAEQAARVMVATSAALADAFIASWGYKFRINLIRPRTYIRAVIDSSWEPTIPTPPFPEYLSGHSTLSAAAATVMTSLLGSVAFDDSTGLSIGHDVRHFGSFMNAAEEAGLSRIYGGIHFPSANLHGRELGKCVGAKVIDRFNATFVVLPK